nr:hypothetical protein [Nocardioides panacis]
MSSSSSSAASRWSAPTLRGAAGRRGRRDQRRPAQQLLEEGRGDAVGALEHRVEPAGVDLEVPAVELEQLPPGGGVGEPERDRLVDAPGARGQGRLEQVGAVGGEQEDHVGVLGQPVHLVEQLEEQRVLAGIPAPVLRDQVDVLDHDHRRLQGPGDRAGRADQMQGGPGELDDRDARELADEVAHRVRLADAGRPVQEQPPLEVLAGGQQPLAVLRDADHLAADRGQRLRRQDHVAAAQARPAVEPQRRVAVPEQVVAEGDHLPTEHVVHQRQPADLRGGRRRHARPVRDHVHLDLTAPAVRVGGQHHHREPGVAVEDEVDPGAHRLLHLPVGAGRETGPGDVARGRAVPEGLPLQQVPQTELPVLVVDHADQAVRAVPGRQPDVQPGLHVDQLVGRPGVLDHLQVTQRRLQVRGDQLGEGGPVRGPRRTDHAASYAPGEPAHVGQPQPLVTVAHVHRDHPRLVPRAAGDPP